MADGLAGGAEKPDTFGEPEPEAPTMAEQADAALDDALDKALGGEEDDDEADLHLATPAENKGAKGAAAEDDEPDEDDEEAEESPDEDEDDEESPKAEAEKDEDDERDELDEAYATLLSLPKGIRPRMSDLKTMSRSKLIAWAGRVEAAGVEASAAVGGREKQAAGAKSDSEVPARAPSVDMAAKRKALADAAGLEESNPLIDELIETREALETLRAEQAENTQASREREGRATIDREMRALEKRFPELRSDSEKRQSVIDEATTILAGRKARGLDLGDARTIFEKASRAVLGAPKRSDLAQLRRNGSSMSPERIGNGRSAPLDEDSYFGVATDIAFDDRLSPEQKRARIAGLKGPPMLGPKRR